MSYTKNIDPAETMGKKCIAESIQRRYEEQAAEMERNRQEQYEEDHKDDELREKILSIAEDLDNDNLNIDFVNTKITFRNIDPEGGCIFLSDKQLLSISAIVLKDRAKGYIEYEEETEEYIKTETIPLKYIETLEYIITINNAATTAFSTEICYKLKDDAPKEAELVYSPYVLCGCVTEISKEEDEALKRRCRISGSRKKNCTCNEKIS